MNDFDRRHTSDGFDPDAAFAEIVAHLNDEPTVENATSTDETSAHETSAHETSAHEISGEPTPNDPADGDVEPVSPAQPLPSPQIWRAHEVDEDYEEHFEPRPVAPLPVGDLQFWAIIAGMCGGPLLLLYFVFFNREASRSWMLTAIAISVAGFIALVSRLPRHKDDGDDGARL
jgi:hypothetical protein